MKESECSMVLNCWSPFLPTISIFSYSRFSCNQPSSNPTGLVQDKNWRQATCKRFGAKVLATHLFVLKKKSSKTIKKIL